MAKRIGDRTKIPSLVLGCEDTVPGLQDGAPLLYGSHISWSSAVSPTWTETRPALAFDQLFRTDRGREDRRVVDAVLEDAQSLKQRLSASDRQRFEEYLGSVHEIEGRIKRAGQEREAGGWTPSLNAPDRPRPADGIPAEIPDYWKLMNDIVLLAFRTDSTRIATLKYCNDGSAETHTHCGAKDQHHQMAHTQPAELIPLNQFFMSQLAYLCERMSEVKEADGTPSYGGITSLEFNQADGFEVTQPAAGRADRHTARGPGLSERPAGGVAARRRDRPGLRPGPGRRREGQPFAAWLAAAHCPIVTRTGSAGPGLPDSNSPVSVRV
jgi:hypothetical protein